MLPHMAWDGDGVIALVQMVADSGFIRRALDASRSPKLRTHLAGADDATFRDPEIRRLLARSSNRRVMVRLLETAEGDSDFQRCFRRFAQHAPEWAPEFLDADPTRVVRLSRSSSARLLRAEVADHRIRALALLAHLPAEAERRGARGAGRRTR